MLLGGNGIWEDLFAFSEEGIAVLAGATATYGQVRDEVHALYPRVRGTIGGGPEIYEKLNENGCGMVTFFTRAPEVFVPSYENNGNSDPEGYNKLFLSYHTYYRNLALKPGSQPGFLLYRTLLQGVTQDFTRVSTFFE